MSEAREFGEFGSNSADEFNSESNVLSDLEASLSNDVEVKDLNLPVPNRPNITMIYHPDIEFDLLRSYMRAASNNRKKEFNPLVMSFAVLSKANIGVMINGKQAFDSEGTPLTFTHKQFRDMLRAHDVPSAIRKLYGNEGHIMAVSQKIIEEAGYTDVDLEEGTGPLGI